MLTYLLSKVLNIIVNKNTEQTTLKENKKLQANIITFQHQDLNNVSIECVNSWYSLGGW